MAVQLGILNPCEHVFDYTQCLGDKNRTPQGLHMLGE